MATKAPSTAEWASRLESMDNVKFRPTETLERAPSQVSWLEMPQHQLHFIIRPENWSALVEYCLGIESEKVEEMADFIVVNNKTAIKRAVLVFAPGIPTTDYLHDLTSCLPVVIDSHLESFPSLKAFTAAWPTKSQPVCRLPYSIYEDVLVAETEVLRKGKKSRKILEAITFNDMLLDKVTMEMLKYPTKPESPDWLVIPSTVNRSKPLAATNLLAVDCEMVETEDGNLELARIAVTNSRGAMVYHAFVKPSARVTDFKTRFSGITAKMLDSAKKTLRDVQIWFATHLRLGNVLVGHALNHDLRVLKIVCHDIIDTATLYEHPTSGSAKLPSLKILAETHLSKKIQLSLEGHDPYEDATASMKLALLKQAKGRYFGCRHSLNLAEKLKTINKTTAIIDRQIQLWARGYASTIKICKSDNEVVEQTIRHSPTHDLTVCRLIEFSREYNRLGIRCCEQLDKQIDRLTRELPDDTLLIVFSDRGPSQELQSYLKHKYKVQENRQLSKAEVKELRRISLDAAVSATFATVTGLSNLKRGSTNDVVYSTEHERVLDTYSDRHTTEQDDVHADRTDYGAPNTLLNYDSVRHDDGDPAS